MRLSPNELRALYSRACEAMLPKNNDYAALAKLLLWMECRGLSGHEAIIACEHRSERDRIEFAPDIGKEDWVSINCNDTGLVLNLIQIADFLNWKISNKPSYSIDCGDITNAATGYSAIALLPLITGDRMVVWGHNRKKYLALQRANDAEPTVLEGIGHDHVTSLAIRTYSDTRIFEQDRDNWIAEHKNVETLISAEQFLERARRSILNNITLAKNEYQSICRIADTILVEATDASRKGAGE